MPIAHILDSAWSVRVGGQDVRMELTFREGLTFEAGLPVGTYERVGTSFIAIVGENVRLIIDLFAGEREALAGRMLTRHDGRVLNESATLHRLPWN